MPRLAQRSIFWKLYARWRKWCSLWLPVYCSNLFTIKNMCFQRHCFITSYSLTVLLVKILHRPQVNRSVCNDRTHKKLIHYTHTRLMALFPGLPRWAGTRKVKPIWILLKQETVSGSGISWTICKSVPCSRQITMPAPHHSVFTGQMPFLSPNQQRQSTEGKINTLSYWNHETKLWMLKTPSHQYKFTDHSITIQHCTRAMHNDQILMLPKELISWLPAYKS